MKRKPKSQFKWKRNLFVMLLLGFCFGSLVLLQTQYSRIRMLASISSPFVQRPKIAFLFIARNRLPLDVVWDAFFRVRFSNGLLFFFYLFPLFLKNFYLFITIMEVFSYSSLFVFVLVRSLLITFLVLYLTKFNSLYWNY